ncbi:hypothetical protein E1292_47980 [Nonomuraea deserti]|uniref:DoxX family membrane protein n=1 Tax=Nonomuraea deserti TaxID=1848322 RepID=A0A4R4UD49_9ACTN|nr:hypothetical protein [Nonomuraea deserti]TDC86422.1 hypothetical protein E1292_47980 [Nonomuraea deserti]
MKILARPHQLPPRLAAAAIILNSGLSKSGAGEDTAASLHGMASGTYPFLRGMRPATFTRLLSKTEITIGVALLVPLVPSLLAGAALTGFAAGLLGLYFKTPGLRQEGSLRPSEQGIALAKDVWLLGIGLGLVAEEMRDCHR